MNMHESTLVHITIILVRAMRVAVDSAGLSVCGPASVSNAKVCEQLLVQVQGVFLWTSKHNDRTLEKGYQPYTYTSCFTKAWPMMI